MKRVVNAIMRILIGSAIMFAGFIAFVNARYMHDLAGTVLFVLALAGMLGGFAIILRTIKNWIGGNESAD